MSPADDDRVISLPLEEHTPLTVAEAGLVIDAPAPRRRWLLPVILGGLVIAVGALVVLTRGGTSVPLVDLAAGTCFEPVVTDLSASVDAADCAAGTARVVQKVPSPTEADAPYPGAGALRLLGEGACQAVVDADALVVAIPAPEAWAAGDRTVVCTERQ